MISSSYAASFTNSMLMTQKSLAPALTSLLSLQTCINNSHCPFGGPTDIWFWRLKNEFIISPPICLLPRFPVSGNHPPLSSLILCPSTLPPHQSKLLQLILLPQLYPFIFFVPCSGHCHLSHGLFNSLPTGLSATSLHLCSDIVDLPVQYPFQPPWSVPSRKWKATFFN